MPSIRCRTAGSHLAGARAQILGLADCPHATRQPILRHENAAPHLAPGESTNRCVPHRDGGIRADGRTEARGRNKVEYEDWSGEHECHCGRDLECGHVANKAWLIPYFAAAPLPLNRDMRGLNPLPRIYRLRLRLCLGQKDETKKAKTGPVACKVHTPMIP
jgi:hypothetical protein